MDDERFEKEVEGAEDTLYLCEGLRKSKLPPFIARAIGVTDDPVQRDILLLSVLTVCSYAMPNVYFKHGKNKHEYNTNLMSLIVAPPASGKGVMNEARRLLQPIQDSLSRYGISVFSAGQSSAVAFLTELIVNREQLCIVESEIDTISKNWKREGGDYSDMFRRAFEHEQISRNRMKGTDMTAPLEVKHPQVSVLISGTPNQLRLFLGQGENGLASRFVPYYLTEMNTFDINVTGDSDEEEDEKNDLPIVYQELGIQLYNRWKRLSKLTYTVRYRFTKEQDQKISGLFNDAYYLGLEAMGLPESFDSAVKRLFVNIRRIGAIMTVLRLPMNKPIPEVLYSTEEDFETLYVLAKRLLMHAGMLSLALVPEGSMQSSPGLDKCNSDGERMNEIDLLEKLPQRFSYQDIKSISEETGVAERTLRLRILKLVETKQVVRLSKGQYRKV